MERRRSEKGAGEKFRASCASLSAEKLRSGMEKAKKRVFIQLRVTEEMKKSFKRAADAFGLTVSDYVVRLHALFEEVVMGEQEQKPKPGPLVEDTTVVGGHDKETGAPVIKPKTPDGRADESVEPTDPQEKSDG